MVMVALLSLAVLGMSVPTLPASAAAGTEDECKHSKATLSTSMNIKYLNANQWTHQKMSDNIYYCPDCKISFMKENEIVYEPHKQMTNTRFCACGYQLY